MKALLRSTAYFLLNFIGIVVVPDNVNRTEAIMVFLGTVTGFAAFIALLVHLSN